MIESKDREYEFSSSQNSLIEDLANKMRFVSYFLIVIGIVVILAGFVSLFLTSQGLGVEGFVQGLIQGIIQLLIGVWTFNAAKAFRRIVTTEGYDIENLMGALGELRKLYGLQYWLLIIALIVIVIMIVSILFFGIIMGVMGG
ncbi:MAG: hypothetical protein F6K03_18275 [Kamptonema sp. SIO4C4]|nr:hypothetical protein [Kamptonema sp. SIO4C4]